MKTSTSFYEIDSKGVQRQVRSVTRNEAEGRSRHAAPSARRTNFFLGKLDADLNHHETATFSIWEWSITDSEWQDSGENLSGVRDFFTNDGEAVPAGTCVKVEWYLTTWVVTQAYCSVSDWPSS